MTSVRERTTDPTDRRMRRDIGIIGLLERARGRPLIPLAGTGLLRDGIPCDDLVVLRASYEFFYGYRSPVPVVAG